MYEIKEEYETMRRKANLNLEECLSILALISGMVVIDKDGLIKYLSPDMEERIRRFGDVQEDAEFIGSSILLNILVRWNRTSGNLEIRCPEVEIIYTLVSMGIIYQRNDNFLPMLKCFIDFALEYSSEMK